MALRSDSLPAVRRGAPSTWVAVLVFVGLVGSALSNVWIEPPDGRLPGVALGSHALLLAERSLAFFAIWMLVLVVSAEALAGRLPIEVSGRGLRYAESVRTQDGVELTRETLDAFGSELRALWREMAILAEQ